MIIAFIFFIHALFIIFVGYKKYKSDSAKAAAINVLMIVLLFSVGWSLSTMFFKMFIPDEGFTQEINQDSISLTLLTIAEFFFFKLFYRDLFGKRNTETGS